MKDNNVRRKSTPPSLQDELKKNNCVGW